MMQYWSDHVAKFLRTFVRRGSLLLLAAVTAVVVTVSPLTTRPASAAITDFGLGGNSCAIETVGWVICPTMRTIARLADKGFAYINKSSLSINYNLFGNTGKTYSAWEVMRNIANGLFVVVFLYMIYTYLVGRTGNTYSLKRLLPRLLIAVIAINISYYVGVILIDISNIIGDSIWAIMKNIYGGGSPVMPLSTSANPLSDGNLTKMTGAAMGNTAMVWVLLPLIAAVTITIATISAAAVIVIIMRQAVVAALILAAPLLIVFYLFPNMERFSSQAGRLFMQLLILYPIIALLLGTGQIVSLAAGSWSNQSAPYGGGTGSIVPDAVAAATAVVPLLGVWFLFKNLSSIMSSAGSRLSASFKGRRGEEDKNARVTGKASAGAANAKNATGLGRIVGRRQAFSRNRHRASLGASRLGENQEEGRATQGSRAGLANRQQPDQPSAIQNGLNTEQNTRGETGSEAEKRSEELQDAQVNGQADGLEVENAVAAAVAAGANDQDKEKHVTAKDLFNNLNRSHESKDKERKLSAGGPAPAGSSGGGQSSSTGGSSQPSAPTVNFRAPSMAQGNNIVTGNSVPQEPAKVIAVPVQVDASTLLGQNQHQPPDNVTQPPISGTEEKAKARAQKYLFDAEQDLDIARDHQDVLGHDDKLTEQPHTVTKEDDKDDKGDD